MDLISLLVVLLVVALIVGIAWWALSQIALPPPVHMIVVVVVAIILILLVVHFLLPFAHASPALARVTMEEPDTRNSRDGWIEGIGFGLAFLVAWIGGALLIRKRP